MDFRCKLLNPARAEQGGGPRLADRDDLGAADVEVERAGQPARFLQPRLGFTKRGVVGAAGVQDQGDLDARALIDPLRPVRPTGFDVSSLSSRLKRPRFRSAVRTIAPAGPA